MTSISSSYAAVSPRDRLQTQLLSDISAGTISSGDQTALSSALDAIDKSLSADRAAQSGPPAPGDIKTRIDGLIQGQVDSGGLTKDQATELKQLFSDTFSAHRAHGGRRHHTPPSDQNQDAASAVSPAAASSGDPGQLLDQFLQSLKDAAQQNAPYGQNGSATNPGALSLLFDFTA